MSSFSFFLDLLELSKLNYFTNYEWSPTYSPVQKQHFYLKLQHFNSVLTFDNFNCYLSCRTMAFTSFESFKSSQYVQFIGFLITSSPQKEMINCFTFNSNSIDLPWINPWKAQSLITLTSHSSCLYFQV